MTADSDGRLRSYLRRFRWGPAVLFLIGVILVWSLYQNQSARVGAIPTAGYNTDPPVYEPPVHPSIKEFTIPPINMIEPVQAQDVTWAADPDELVAVTGELLTGHSKVTQAFVQVEIYVEDRDGRKTVQANQATVRGSDGRLPFRTEIRMPSAANNRLRIETKVIHVPWSFDPDGGEMPTGLETETIHDGLLNLSDN